MSKIGFVGLGIMGTPMAGRLLDAGHELYAFARSDVPEELKKKGIHACASSRECAEHSEIFISIVPDTPDVADVLFGKGGAAEGLKKGTIVVDMSSISPIETKEYAKKIEAMGCEYVDAPVSGGDVGAREGTLSIMAGGKKEIFEKVKPLFDAMGKNVTLVGGVGAGQTAKVANQMIVAMNIEAVSEALVFASKAGADPAAVRKAIMGGFASSRVLELHGQKMIDRNFKPGFRIALHQKDLNLALGAAKQMGVALPNTATCQELFNGCAAHGGKAWDHSAMVKMLEMLSDCEVGLKK